MFRCMHPTCPGPREEDATARFCGDCGNPLPWWASKLGAGLVAYRTLVRHASGDTAGHGFDVVTDAAGVLGELSDDALEVILGPHTRRNSRAHLLSLFDMARSTHLNV